MDPRLLIALAVGIAVVILVVLKTRLDAFIGLFLAALVAGSIVGQPLATTLSQITTGFGNTLGGVGIVIALGVGIGKILEVSGAIEVLANWVLRRFGKGREDIAMGSVGALIAVPVFADSAFMIMAPLARQLARLKGSGYLAIMLAMSAGMVLTHTMVPPTPGPLAVAGILGADLGQVILWGLIFTVILLPIAVIYSRWAERKYASQISPEIQQLVYGDRTAANANQMEYAGAVPAGAAAVAGAGAGAGFVGSTELPAGYEHGSALETDGNLDSHVADAEPVLRKPISALLAWAILLIPILLIVAGTTAMTIARSQAGIMHGAFDAPAWTTPFTFLGNPVIALTIGVILAVYFLLPRYTPRSKVHGWLAEGINEAGIILVITGAGGAFGFVLRESGIGDALGHVVGGWHIPLFLIPFLISLFIRIAQGSATVAMITAASIVAPMAYDLGLNPVVATLAAALASGAFSHYNDSLFWILANYVGLDAKAMLFAWTGLKGVVCLAGIPLLWIMDLILSRGGF